ncbi:MULTISPECIES: ash family protein [Yersinia]|nr:ash family protein [Yersinia thracica]HED0394328.1 ash family protein [Yersinia enterocolitica]
MCRHSYICKTMVSWAGASQDAPDSLLTGSSNPAQFTTHKEIGTSRW